MDNKLCLLIETTSSKGSIGLYCLNSVSETLNSIQQWEGSCHSRYINLALKALFKKNEAVKLQSQKEDNFVCNFRDKITYIVLGVGPGRFTGVRVGVSFAKTLGYILDIPIYPISSLKILAASQIKQEKPILVLLNAFKNSLYMAVYQNKNSQLQQLIPPSVVLPQNLDKIISQQCVCVGDGYQVYQSFWSEEFKKKIDVKNNIFPEIKYIPSLLKREFKTDDLISWDNLKPVYLRTPVQAII